MRARIDRNDSFAHVNCIETRVADASGKIKDTLMLFIYVYIPYVRSGSILDSFPAVEGTILIL